MVRKDFLDQFECRCSSTQQIYLETNTHVIQACMERSHVNTYVIYCRYHLYSEPMCFHFESLFFWAMAMILKF